MKTAVYMLLFLLACPSVTTADTIYKSVDENGNVTYSTTPPADSKTSTRVDIAPPPSEERIKAAQQRQERNLKAAEMLDENRKKRDEITAEDNRIKQERQRQLRQQQEAETNNENQNYNGYPYYYPRRLPGRPAPERPIIVPPVAAPAR